MKDFAIISALFAAGVATGLLGDWIGVNQSAYTEGRNSVLSHRVKISTDLCGYVEIPIEALADMVNAGIMDWQKSCMEKVNQ